MSNVISILEGYLRGMNNMSILVEAPPCADLEYCIEFPTIVVHFKMLREYRDSNNMSMITYHTGYMYGYLDAMCQTYRKNIAVVAEIAFLSDFLDFRFR